MDESFDPTLEPTLRQAMRAEADAIPFRIRAADVRAAAAAQARSRRRRVPLAIAAALVLVAVGGLVVVATYRGIDVTGAAAPGTGGPSLLPAYERLHEASIQGPELARGEGVVAAGGAVLHVPVMKGFHPSEVAFACSGPGVTLSAAGDRSPIRDPLGGPGFDCSAGVSRSWIAGPAAMGVAADGLRIDADPGTAWRAIVVGLPDTADVIAGTTPVAGLPSFADLAAAESRSLPEVARAAAAATAESSNSRIQGLGGPRTMQSVVACTGGPLTLVWADGPTWSKEDDGGALPCEGVPFLLPWKRLPGAVDASELHVYAPAGTAWIMLVQDTSSPTSPSPAP